MLFLEIFNLTVEVVVKFRLQTLNLLSVFYLFVVQIVSESVLFFPELSDFKLSLFVQSDKLHVQVADFILLLFAVFFQLSGLKLVFLVIVEVISFYGLDLYVMLVLKLTYLHVFHMLNVGDFLFELLYLVQKSSVFEVT